MFANREKYVLINTNIEKLLHDSLYISTLSENNYQTRHLELSHLIKI